ncbi:MAG: tetratricopeptide repeat protein, partial [Clostridiales bacterium]|nr:tetratricopeptide repeat protein [Clostridiales bacterium]
YLAAVEEAKAVTDRGELSRAWSVYDNAAEIFCARSDYQSAIKLMTDALEVKDNFYAGAFVRLIDLYLLVKQTDKALDIATRMRKLRPDDPVAHMKYAECCVAVMDYAQAAAAYNILATQFGLYENLFDEASCHIELGDYEKAVASLNAHPAKELYEQYWYYLAYMEYNSHRLWQALKYVEKSHELDNAYLPALLLLIDIESLLNEYYAVARYAEEYKKLRPDNEYGYSVCGEAHLMLGNFSECARNYHHIYKAIKNDDKYAALAAIVGTKTGESKRSNSLLKKLKRKKSAYYSGARYGMFITKSRARNVALERDVYKLGSDDDFLLTLAVFLYKTGDVVHSMRVLDTLYKDDNLPFEAVAQHIRAAEKIGDKKHFLSFFEYYINNFISPAATPDERVRVAESFIVNSAHRSWIREIRK